MSFKRSAALLLFAASTGCMGTYRVQPADYITAHAPAQILVLDNVGTIHLVDGPSMKGDTLLGIENGTPDSLSLPVSQVEDALVRRHSKGRTTALIVGLTAGVGMAVAAIATQGTANACKPGNNKTNQAGNVIGGSTQCDTSGDDGITENRY